MVFAPYPLRIVTGRAMAEIDRISIEDRGVPGQQLMNRAGESVARRILASVPTSQLFDSAILCGRGNNGGDGFVISRILHKEGYSPQVALLASGAALKGDAQKEYQRALECGVCVYECETEADLDAFLETACRAQVWVDALLGTGASGAPRGLFAKAVQAMNARAKHCWVAAVDVCSGVDADSGAVAGDAVYADAVYTMGLPKVGHVLPPGLNYYQSLEVLDIGFPLDLMQAAESCAELLQPRQIDDWLLQPGRSSHKGSKGHVLTIAGSRGMTGAALLCARAAVKMGAGLVTAACPASLLPLYANGVWEMMTLPVDETASGAFSQTAFDQIDFARFDAVVIGPGLGRDESTQALVKRACREIKQPLLIDGDGLFALSLSDLQARAAPWVITPHPGEAARLLECSTADVQTDRWGAAQKLAVGNGVVALKGPKTLVAKAGEPHLVNPTGNPAMASGGMGDTLAGMIGALLANGLAPQNAAACGAYLHGLAADIIVEESGAESLAAGEISNALPAALAAVRNSCKQRAMICA
ncbi:MAG: NAD(P)H-hydrate dehydratase [Candidatus Hinthialibacter antarcticus]|nr:NAD(P)H-hydrate dehydratase [Candidatus Hinthialibacter antarcticus]